MIIKLLTLVVVALIGITFGMWRRGGNNTAALVVIGTTGAVIFTVATCAPELLRGSP